MQDSTAPKRKVRRRADSAYQRSSDSSVSARNTGELGKASSANMVAKSVVVVDEQSIDETSLQQLQQQQQQQQKQRQRQVSADSSATANRSSASFTQSDSRDAVDGDSSAGSGHSDGPAGALDGNASVGLTQNLVCAVLASSVCAGFQHGYNGGVVNAPEKFISQFINDTYTQRHTETPSDAQLDLLLATVVSIFCVGGFIGALATAPIADRVGRKEGLLLNNALVLLASPLMSGARSFKSYELLIVGRLIIGVNAGLNAGLAALYTNEIAPRQLRDSLGAVYQLVITSSIFVSNVFGLPSLLGSQDGWPLLFALPLAPAAFMFVALPRCAESPRQLLLVNGRELEAQRALSWFRQTNDVQDEMEALIAESDAQRLAPKVNLATMLTDKRLRKPLTVAVIIMLSQQLSGINAVLFFSTSIIRGAGLSERSALHATLGLSLLNFLVTLASVPLVERFGRKTLQLTGLMGMAVACVVLAASIGGGADFAGVGVAQGASFASNNSSLELPTAAVGRPLEGGVAAYTAVAAMYLFIVMFASGPGSIPWFLVGELFPANARSLAWSIAVAVNWLANFAVLLSFLPLTNLLHGYVFLVFAALLLLFYAFTYLKVPETKGATADEIEALFQNDF